MTPSELYQAGKLSEAIAASNEAVKKHPAELGPRGLLTELLCFAGELEKADKQLDLIVSQDPQSLPGIALFRQLVRGEMARQQFFREGRVPEFLAKPSELLQKSLQASIALREGNQAAASELLAAVEELRPKASGTCDGKAFDDFRDLDDLCAPFLEVLTSTGKYYWVPIESIEFIEFRAPKRPRDLLWRQTLMTVNGGPDGEVYIPCLYADTHTQSDDRVRLGRVTDWAGGENSQPVRGLGLREFLVGDEAMTILQITNLKFNESRNIGGESSAPAAS